MQKNKKIFGNKKPNQHVGQQSSNTKFLDKKSLELLTDIPIIKREKKEGKQNQTKDLQKMITFKFETSYPNIQKKGVEQTLPLMATIQTDESESESERLGLDLVMIIDISGSMGGEKIKLVRETLLFIVDELKEIDRLSLVVFDNKVEILTNLMPVTEKSKTQFMKIIKNMDSRNSTDIRKGLLAGFEVLLNRREVNDVTSVFLLSDGQDNCGNNK